MIARDDRVFIGRERELGVCDAVLAEARAGHGQLLLLSGDPGIGKTRLAVECAVRAQAQGMRVLWGRAWEGDGAPAFWPWMQIVRAYLRESERSTLTADLGRAGAEIVRVMPEVETLLPDESRVGTASLGLQPEQERFRFFDGLTLFLKAASRRQPLLLVLDDLQWADTPSLLLWQFLTQELGDSHLLVVGTYRENELASDHPLFQVLGTVRREPVCRLLTLGGLQADEIGRYVETLSDQQPSAELLAMLAERTEGNPFFLRELVQLMMADGSLHGADDARRWRQAIPIGIRQVIGRRVAGLPVECRHLLTLASAIGQGFDVDLLSAVAAAELDEGATSPRDRARATLATVEPAVAAGLLRADNATRYSFTHAMIREALYAEQDMPTRPWLHRRIGEALERQGVQAPLSELAHHFSAAGVATKAFAYARQAGDRALVALAYEEAATMYRRALDLLDDGSERSSREHCTLLLALEEAAMRGGDIETARTSSLEAAAIARAISDIPLFARAALGFGWHFDAGVVDDARIALLREALGRLDTTDSPLRARLAARLAVAVYFSPGSYEWRAALSAEAVAMARRLGDPGTLAFTLNARLYTLWVPDDTSARLELSAEFLQLAEACGDSELALQSRHWLVADLLESGELELARRHIVAHAELATRQRQPLYLWGATKWRAALATIDGRFADAEAAIAAAYEIGKRAEPRNAETSYLTQQFSLLFERGDLDSFADAAAQWRVEGAFDGAYACGRALLFWAADRADALQRELTALRGVGLANIPRDVGWLPALCLLAAPAAAVAETPFRESLYALLLPFRGRIGIAGMLDTCTGSVSRHLGLLATSLDRYGEAEAHFADALAMHERMRARPLVARTQHDWAAMLLRRGAPGDVERALPLLAAALATARELGMKSVEAKAAALHQSAVGRGQWAGGDGRRESGSREAEVTGNREPATSTFVGRAEELAQLRAALAQAAAGTGRVVMLAGEPGIGKTRTAAELADEAHANGALVLRGSCYEGEWGHAYGPFVEALTAHVRVADPTQLAADLGAGAAPLARLVPALRERLPDIGEPVPLQPDEERFRLFDAVSQFLIAVAKRAPLVLLLDDLHWADRGTLALLRHLAHFVPGHPILLLGAYRDIEVDVAHPLAELLGALRRESKYERIMLKGLDDAETGELITALAAKTIAAPIMTGITAHAEGNPFFVHEMVRHLSEENALGDVDLRSFPDLALPDGIRHLIGRRLARLSATANRLLTVASVFAGPFHFAIASAVADLEPEAALSAIDEALRAHLVQPTAHADRYDFTHALFRHALYAELNPSRRARLHRSVAETMERMFADRIAERAGEIAEQYRRSSDLPGAERAVPHALIAAERAEATHAFEEVAKQVRLALELLTEEDPRRPQLLRRLASALTWSLNFIDAVPAVREASNHIMQAEGEKAAADFLAEAAWSLSNAGYTPGAWTVATDGLALAGARRDATWASLTFFDLLRQAADAADGLEISADSTVRDELARVANQGAFPPARRWLLAGHGVCAMFTSRQELLRDTRADPTLLTFWGGEYRRCRRLWQENAVAAEKAGHIAFAVECWAQLSRVMTAMGEAAAGRDAYQRGTFLARRFSSVSRQTLQLVAARFEAVLAADEGWKEFLREQRALTENLEPENGFGLTAIQAAAAAISARLGRSDDALLLVALVPPALERAPGWVGNYSQIACDAADVLWLLNRRDQTDVLERVLQQRVLTPDFRYPMRDARQAMARLCALRTSYDEAVAWFAQARAVLDEQSARPLRAIVDYDEALMYARRNDANDQERARRLLGIALTQFRPLGMPGWIRRAEHLLEHGREWTPDQAATGDGRQESGRREGEAETRDERPETRNQQPGTWDAGLGTAIFRRSGDMWAIRFNGVVVQLRHTRGLQYLVALLAQPGRELHATEVIGTPVAATAPSRATDAEQAIAADLGDAGTVLDAAATSQYQRRLSELREELAEAEANHDLGRTAALRDELEFLAEQLASAGRGRRVASHAERARVTVAKGIAAAMKKIAAAHPALGRHLKATIRTGYFCSYTPDPRVDWDV